METQEGDIVSTTETLKVPTNWEKQSRGKNLSAGEKGEKFTDKKKVCAKNPE